MTAKAACKATRISAAISIIFLLLLCLAYSAQAGQLAHNVALNSTGCSESTVNAAGYRCINVYDNKWVDFTNAWLTPDDKKNGNLTIELNISTRLANITIMQGDSYDIGNYTLWLSNDNITYSLINTSLMCQVKFCNQTHFNSSGWPAARYIRINISDRGITGANVGVGTPEVFAYEWDGAGGGGSSSPYFPTGAETTFLNFNNNLIDYGYYNGAYNGTFGNGSQTVTPTYSVGKFDKALDFRAIKQETIDTAGVENLTILNSTGTLNTTSFTVSLWVKTITTNGAMSSSTILTHGQSAAHAEDEQTIGWGIFMTGTSKVLHTYFWYGAGNKVDLAGNIRLNTATPTWEHLVVTKNTTHWTFYVNGTQRSQSATFGTYNQPQGDMMLGHGQYPYSGLNGSIDDFRIFSEGLTASQVAAIYNNGYGTELPLNNISTTVNVTLLNNTYGYITNFSVNATDLLTGNSVNASSTNNGTAKIVLTRNTTWQLAVWNTSNPAYAVAYVNVTTSLGRDSENVTATTGRANSISFTVYNEKTNTLIIDNNISIGLTGSAPLVQYNASTLNGTLQMFDLLPNVYVISAGSTDNDYQTKQYIVTLPSGGNEHLNVYLLNSSVGSYVTFSILNNYNQLMPNVNVAVTRQINNSFLTVEQRTTDVVGSARFFMDVTVTYKLLINAAGYTTREVVVMPTSTTYSITLSPTATVNYTTIYNQMSYSTSPGSLLNNSVNTFTFTTSSATGQLQYYGQSFDFNGTTYSTTISGSPAGGTISQPINLSNATGQTILVRYVIKTGTFPEYNFTRTYTVEGEQAAANTLLEITRTRILPELSTTMRLIIASVVAVCAAVVTAPFLGGLGAGFVGLIALIGMAALGFVSWFLIVLIGTVGVLMWMQMGRQEGGGG